MQPAGIGKRYLAFIIDFVLTLFIAAFFTWSLTRIIYLSKFWAVFLWSIPIFYTLYQSFSVTITGKTIGKKLLGLKIILSKESKQPPLLTELLRESVFKSISVIPLGLGFSLAIFDKNRKAWHDKLSGTQVISVAQETPPRGDSHRFAKIALFIFLLVFSAAAEWIFPVKAILTSLPEPIPCYFQDGKFLTKSNHFKIYLETGIDSLIFHRVSQDPILYKLMFEQAFDYSFWLISPISARTSQSTICLYKNEKNFSDAYSYHGGNSPAFTFFRPLDQSIHFRHDFLDKPIEEQKNTIYHEVNHFVLFLYLAQNNYPFLGEVPAWFIEGLAYLVEYHYQESSLPVSDLKNAIAGNQNAWRELSRLYLLDKESVWSYYDQSLLIMKFLEEKYGTGVFPKIIQAAAGSQQPMETAIENITNENLASLESEWKIWLTK